MYLQLDGAGDAQRTVPLAPAQLGYQLVVSTVAQYLIYVLVDSLLQVLVRLLERFRLRALDAWGLYLDRFSVRGLSPGIAGSCILASL